MTPHFKDWLWFALVFVICFLVTKCHNDDNKYNKTSYMLEERKGLKYKHNWIDKNHKNLDNITKSA